jgi:hypothetical protein
MRRRCPLEIRNSRVQFHLPCCITFLLENCKKGPRGSAPRFAARRFFCGLRQSSELVSKDHSYRRHSCSRKSRYFRRAIGECGFRNVGGAEELASFPILCSTTDCVAGQNTNRVNETSWDDPICGGVIGTKIGPDSQAISVRSTRYGSSSPWYDSGTERCFLN